MKRLSLAMSRHVTLVQYYAKFAPLLEGRETKDVVEVHRVSASPKGLLGRFLR